MKTFKKLSVFISAVIVLSLLSACSESSATYPEEAYINPVGEAIAESAYAEESGGNLDAGVRAEDVLYYNGFESAEESTLKAILSGDDFVNDGCSYYYKIRTYSTDGVDVLSPIIYAIPYDNNILCQSTVKHISDSSDKESYYACYGYCYLSYQYVQSGGRYKLITKSNMIMACVINTTYTLYNANGNPVKTNITANWQYQIAPYFDDAASSYLNDVEIPENVCMKKFTVTEDGNEICKFTFNL